MPTVTCRCGSRLKVNKDTVGRRLQCPNCRQRFRIIPPSDSNEGGAEDPPRQSTGGDPDASPLYEYAEDAAADEAPLRQRIEPLRKKRVSTLPSTDLLMAFTYPLSTRGLIVLGACSTVVPVFMIICVINFFPIIGQIGALFVTMYIWAYISSVAYETGAGEEDVPQWPDIGDAWNDVIRPYGRLIGTQLLSFLPFILLVWLGPRHGPPGAVFIPGAVVLFLAGLFYLPMAYLCTCMQETLRAASPHIVVRALRVTFWDYLKVYGLCVVLCLMLAGVWVVGIAISPFVLFLSIFPVCGISTYLLMVVMRLLGLLYRRNADRLAWFLEDD